MRSSVRSSGGKLLDGVVAGLLGLDLVDHLEVDAGRRSCGQISPTRCGCGVPQTKASSVAPSAVASTQRQAQQHAARLSCGSSGSSLRDERRRPFHWPMREGFFWGANIRESVRDEWIEG